MWGEGPGGALVPAGPLNVICPDWACVPAGRCCDAAVPGEGEGKLLGE